MKDRNHIIDILRIMAATMVVFFHFNESVPFVDNYYRSIIKLGWLGVPIFFVISGYCILLTANASKNGFDFLIRRIFRIFPSYWFSLLIVLFFVGIHKYLRGVNDVTPLPKDIKSILFTVVLYIHPISKVVGINWVYWSLACEICFYLLITIGLIIFRKYLPFFITVVLSCSIIFTGISNDTWYYFLKDWPCFCMGVGIFYLHNVTDKKMHGMEA